MVIGNCVIDDPIGFLNEPYYVGDDDLSKEKNAKWREKEEFYAKKWEELVNSVANEFDELVKMMLMDGPEIGDYQEFDKNQKELEKKSFF